MTTPRDFEPAEIDKDTDDDDGVPVGDDVVPDVAEDPVPAEDDPSTSPEGT